MDWYDIGIIQFSHKNVSMSYINKTIQKEYYIKAQLKIFKWHNNKNNDWNNLCFVSTRKKMKWNNVVVKKSLR